MAAGPGKYDDLCTLVRERTNAAAVVVMVLGGDRGTGFSAQGPVELSAALPELLENMAREIRASLPR